MSWPCELACFEKADKPPVFFCIFQNNSRAVQDLIKPFFVFFLSFGFEGDVFKAVTVFLPLCIYIAFSFCTFAIVLFLDTAAACDRNGFGDHRIWIFAWTYLVTENMVHRSVSQNELFTTESVNLTTESSLIDCTCKCYLHCIMLLQHLCVFACTVLPMGTLIHNRHYSTGSSLFLMLQV